MIEIDKCATCDCDFGCHFESAIKPDQEGCGVCKLCYKFTPISLFTVEDFWKELSGD